MIRCSLIVGVLLLVVPHLSLAQDFDRVNMPPEEVVTAFLEAFNQGNWQAMLSYLNEALGTNALLMMDTPPRALLCLDAIPATTEVRNIYLPDYTALVSARLDEQPVYFELTHNNVRGWTITGIACGNSPEMNVLAFYEGYLQTGTVDSQSMTDTLNQSLAADTSFDVAACLGIQDRGVAQVEQVFFDVDRLNALVVMEVLDAGFQRYPLYLSMQQQGERWLVNNIYCAGSAEAVALAFGVEMLGSNQFSMCGLAQHFSQRYVYIGGEPYVQDGYTTISLVFADPVRILVRLLESEDIGYFISEIECDAG